MMCSGPLLAASTVTPLDLFRIATGYGGHFVERVRSERSLQGSENCFHFDGLPICERHFVLPFQLGVGRVEFFRIKDLECIAAADDKEAPVVGNYSGLGICCESRYLHGQQPFACILANKHRKIGEILEKGGVIGFTVNDDLGHAEPQRGIGIGLDRHPFVGLGSGAAEVWIDYNNSTSSFGSKEVMCVGEAGLNDVGPENERSAGIDPFERFLLFALHAEGHRPKHRQIAVLVVPMMHGPVG